MLRSYISSSFQLPLFVISNRHSPSGPRSTYLLSLSYLLLFFMRVRLISVISFPVRLWFTPAVSAWALISKKSGFQTLWKQSAKSRNNSYLIASTLGHSYSLSNYHRFGLNQYLYWFHVLVHKYNVYACVSCNRLWDADLLYNNVSVSICMHANHNYRKKRLAAHNWDVKSVGVVSSRTLKKSI